jgi:hypothetical protein
MKKLVVLAFHGIGTYWEDFQVEGRRFDRFLKSGLRSRLGAAFDEIVWAPVLWSDRTLEQRQAGLLARRRPPALWRGLFEFVASSLTDATAYKLTDRDEDYRRSAYFRIQALVRSSLRAVESSGPAIGGLPVFGIADSMGCRVLSSYAWDADRHPARIVDEGENPDALTDFQRLRTIAGLVYTGCNLPLLTMDIPNSATMPMKLPLNPLPGRPEFVSAWLNYYDGDDVLGYPIDQEYSAYFGGTHDDRDQFPAWNRDPSREQRPRDMKVSVGGIPGITPFAHLYYWRSSAILDEVARQIKRLLAAL